MKHLIIILLLTTPVFGTMISFDADDFADGENMHTPVPEMTLWRTAYGYGLDKLYTDVFAITSSDPAKPLGERVIGAKMIPRWDWWDYWSDEPYLYITINGLASSISISTANKPGWINKTIIVDCWDIDGNQVAHNFTKSGRLTTNVGEYTISSVAIYTSGMKAIDDIEINYIPEPTTLLLLGLGVVLVGRKRINSEPQ